MKPSAPPRVIVALDVPDLESARGLLGELEGMDFMCKVGLELYSAGLGHQLASELARQGRPVFVDLKLLDIPATVARATAAVARTGATFLTVHAHGPAMEAAVASAGGTGILAVTLLTSPPPSSSTSRAGPSPPGRRAAPAWCARRSRPPPSGGRWATAWPS